jgi:phosphohistidine phosphatase
MDPFRVYLVRHAAAEREAPGGDVARPLTPAGRRAFEALLASLRARGELGVTCVRTSPFVRARQTAELLAHRASAPLEDDAALASGCATGAELLAAARAAGPGAAIVGHNPEVAEAIALAGAHDPAVPPGAIAAIVLEGDGGARLAWLEAPPERGH